MIVFLPQMLIEITVFCVYSFSNVENVSHYFLCQFSGPLSANPIIHVIRLSGFLGKLIDSDFFSLLHPTPIHPTPIQDSRLYKASHLAFLLLSVLFLYFNFFLQQRVELFPDSLCEVETATRSQLQNLSEVDKRLSVPESLVYLLFGFIDPRDHVFTINLLLLQGVRFVSFQGSLSQIKVKLASLQVSFSTSAVVALRVEHVF